MNRHTAIIKAAALGTILVLGACRKPEGLDTSSTSSANIGELTLGDKGVPIAIDEGLGLAALIRPQADEVRVALDNGDTKIVNWKTRRKASDQKAFVKYSADKNIVVTPSDKFVWVVSKDDKKVGRNGSAYEKGTKVDINKVGMDKALKFKDDFRVLGADDDHLFLAYKDNVYVYTSLDGKVQERVVSAPVRIEGKHMLGAGAVRDKDSVVGYWLFTTQAFYRYTLNGDDSGAWRRESLPRLGFAKKALAVSVALKKLDQPLKDVLATAVVMADDTKLYEMLDIKPTKKGGDEEDEEETTSTKTSAKKTSTKTSASTSDDASSDDEGE